MNKSTIEKAIKCLERHKISGFELTDEQCDLAIRALEEMRERAPRTWETVTLKEVHDRHPNAMFYESQGSLVFWQANIYEIRRPRPALGFSTDFLSRQLFFLPQPVDNFSEVIEMTDGIDKITDKLQGFTKSQLNEIMLKLQSEAEYSYNEALECERIQGPLLQLVPWHRGKFHGLLRAAQLLTSYHLGIKL